MPGRSENIICTIIHIHRIKLVSVRYKTKDTNGQYHTYSVINLELMTYGKCNKYGLHH